MSQSGKELSFRKNLLELKAQIEGGETEFTKSAQKKIDKYLTCSKKGRGGQLKVGFNNEAIAEAKRARSCRGSLSKSDSIFSIDNAMKDLSEKDFTSLLLVPKLITFLVPYHFNNVTATLTLLPNGALELHFKYA